MRFGSRRTKRAGPRRALCGGALAAALAVSAAAADQMATPAPDAQPEAQGAEHFYDAESWRALVEGKTLTYRASFGIMGREYYVPGSNRVVFIYFDGRCYDGTWEETDGVFCFAYDGLHCFEHLTRGDTLIAREMDGEEQIVTEMTDETLSCEPDMISRAPRSSRRGNGKDDRAS